MNDNISIMEVTGGKPQYKYPPHYNQPIDCPLYFLQHHINWLVKMPDLLTKDCCTLEIGALYGGASMFMLDKYVKSTGHHTIIDINTNEYIQNNLKPYKGKYTYIMNESGDAMRTLSPDHFDLVYIDGNHMSKYVLEDAVNAYYVTKEGGYIVFDDYGWGNGAHHTETPRTAIDLFIFAYDKHIEVKSIGYQVIIQKKKYEMTSEQKSANYVKNVVSFP